MNDREFPFRVGSRLRSVAAYCKAVESVPMRVAVQSRGRTMGGPSSVSDASVRVKDLGHVDTRFVNELPQLCYLAHLFEGEDFILLVTINGQTCRIIASVF